MRTYVLIICCLCTLGSFAQTWSYVGPCCIESDVDALSSAGSEDLGFLSDGTPVVSFFRQTGFVTTGKVRMFSGGIWDQVGGDLPATGTISAIDMEIYMDDIYVSIVTGGTQIRIYHFSGTEWVQLGEMISGNMAYDFVIDNEGTLYVFNSFDQIIRRYNGTSWETALDLNESVAPAWTGDRSVVVNNENHMFYYQSFLNMATFTFENFVHRFDGTAISQEGEMVFGGLGTPGRIVLDQDNQIYAQYLSNSTNKICVLDGTSWNHILDTTNAVNGLFQFKYTFNASNEMLLSVFANVYYADGYIPLPALPATGIPTSVNNMVLDPDGKLYISLGEVPVGSGSNFSVMTLDEAVDIVSNNHISPLLYPNPSTGVLHIDAMRTDDIVQVFDMQGRVIFDQLVTIDGTYEIVHRFDSGSYYLVVTRGVQIFTQVFQSVQ